MPPTPLIGYADCFSGISGDMFLGALLHCGLPLEYLQTEIKKLDLPECTIDETPHQENGISSLKVKVSSTAQQSQRHLPSILAILDQAELPDTVTGLSQKVFMALAQAEAKVHGCDIEQVHFHEVGAVDSIVDIVGTAIGLDYLGVTSISSSPLPTPRGFVNCDHGKLPLPAPAVCEILQNVPCYGVDLKHELVTPTGAALIKTLSSGYGPLPPMTMKKTGYGAGSTILSNNQPNLFRFIIGEPASVHEQQQVEIIETNLDDWSPEGFPHLCELLLNKGALDVSLAPIQMKKGRPGFKLQIICTAAHSTIIKNILFTETTAIGLRFHTMQRQTLPRETVNISTPWGKIAAKKVILQDGERVYPEYEQCRKIALKHGVALQDVYQSVLQTKSTS